MEGLLNKLNPKDDLKDKEIEEVEEIDAKKAGEALLVLKYIFRSTGIVHGQKYTIVIDGGS